MKGRIALVQFRSSKSDETNIERMEGFIKKEKGKSDLIVFPELSIKRTFSDIEEEVFLEVLCDIAKNNRIDIVPGSIFVRSGAKTYNRSYYIDRNGKVIAKYNKTNLWKSEKLSKGSGPKAFKTRFGRTSLIICWDLASPAVASRLSRLRLDLIICPSMWWQGMESGTKANFTWKMIDSLCLARAYESKSVVAFVNTAGKIEMRRFTDLTAGRTQVTAPFENLICDMKGCTEGVMHYDFDLTPLVLARKYFGYSGK